MNSFTCTLTDEQGKALAAWLRERGFEFREVPYARYAAVQGRVGVVLYQSGKLVVQGKGTREFVEFVLEPIILKEARLGYEAVHDPEMLVPRIGIDESGKGDFFGPLCVAGVYVNASIVKRWREAGVRDSKRISSSKVVMDLAEMIRRTPGCVWVTVPIGNDAYNRLYAKMGNVNAMLAWGHARAIENLMQRKEEMDPPPVRAISDQFARSKHVVEGALMKLGREIVLVQKHRAEEDLAVAAASILAREAFLTRMTQMEKEWGVALPRGASAQVEAAGVELVKRHGSDVLRRVAKLHFQTAARVLEASGAGERGIG